MPHLLGVEAVVLVLRMLIQVRQAASRAALLARQAQEQNDLTQAICSGLADGRFDHADAAKALREVDDVIRVAAAMRAELKMLMEEA